MRSLLQAIVAMVTLALLASLSGCITLGHASDPIPTRFVGAPHDSPPAERTLVIVLPGIGAGAADLQRYQVAAAIQRQWPEADTLLTSAALAYYGEDGGLVRRVHEELILPARALGYRRIWLIGASLGGLGALLYEQQYPGELSGVVAFAPFLGGEALPDQIRKAGGIEHWQGPDVLAAPLRNPYLAYPRLVWAMARDWLFRPDLAGRIWIVCGDDDNLKPGVDLLATALPDANYVKVEGGHRWSVWLSSLGDTLQRIRASATS